MAKNEEEKLNERLAQIQHWQGVRDEAVAKLKELTGIGSPQKPVSPLPEGLTLSQAILAVFQDNASKNLRVADVMKAIANKYNSNQERKTVQSTVQYLTNQKHALEKVDKGLFRLKNKQSTE